VYYIDDHNKKALQSFIKKNRAKIISYQDLKWVTKVFGVSLDAQEKQDMVRFKHNDLILRKKDGGFLSSNRQSQTRRDDFQGKKPFLGKDQSQKSKKLQDTISDFLREIEDSLVESYIPMYFNNTIINHNDLNL
jgi:hypothetical protein